MNITSGVLLFALATIPLVGGARGQGNPVPSTPGQVVRQYALTSANDFPQRDPQDWRLLGSNDGGQTWTLLDLRKGELFSERHERRLFQLTNESAFGMYRLQIDRVRDPAAADSVQLAEVEPLGVTETDLEPAPLPEDLIMAQGENAPVETRLQAFDGRIETKWLDHAERNPGTRASWIQWRYSDRTGLVITNVQRLQALRNRASHGFSVSLEGVIVGRVGGTERLCFLDGSGHFEVPVSGEADRFLPGQRVHLEGSSEWAGGEVRLQEPRFTARAPQARTEPTRLSAEQLLNSEQELEWAEVEGSVQFSAWLENQLVFDLEEDGRSLSVRVLHVAPTARPPAAGARVRVRGVCASLLNAKGERVAGTLWTPGLEAIVELSSTNPKAGVAALAGPRPDGSDPSPVLNRIEQLRRLGPEELARGPRVKIRGVVTEQFGRYVQEESAGVEVWPRGEALQQMRPFGELVELEGKGDWAPGHGPLVRAERIRALGPGKLPKPEHCTWSQLASGRMVDQWIEIVAVVRSTDGSHLLLTCDGGQLMATVRSAPAPRVKELVDATVRVRGVNVAATDSRGQVQGMQLIVPSLEHVEVVETPADPFRLPARPITSLLQVRGPQEFIHRVKVEGILTFRQDRRYFLQNGSGGALAVAQENVVLNSPASGWNWMFWQAQTSSRPSETAQDLNAGDRVQVVGFPETQGYSPVLTEALVRKVGRSAPVPPIKATVADITSGGLDSMLVSLEAVVLERENRGPNYVLDLQAGPRVFQAFLRNGEKRFRPVAPGSRVIVTGVCQIEPQPYAELGRRVASFKLLLASPESLTILERPPWWTLKRVLIVTGALGVVLAVATAWIGILRRQVEERTRQLQQEIEQHKNTEAQLAGETQRVHAEIEERKRIEAEVEQSHKQLLKASRLAGMAEVATSVLHNVGNVLNSVNVLASLVVEQVKTSKAPSLSRLAQLLGQHRGDLGRFMTEDGRGQQVPGYVGRLATHLEEEQSRLLEKMKLLTESIQHIKEIVATQQNYARVSGVMETVALGEIVEDALRIHDGAMARHQIRIVRQYEKVPLVTLDRHKLLQILFNLLENAKYACDDGTGAEKQVTVQIQPQGRDRIQVQVSDNGVGIPEENLQRIFAQEFSTRKGGHGFGLHSSMLAAQDMGGSLSARSEGAGRGATFTLEIPVAQRAAEP